MFSLKKVPKNIVVKIMRTENTLILYNYTKRSNSCYNKNNN